MSASYERYATGGGLSDPSEAVRSGTLIQTGQRPGVRWVLTATFFIVAMAFPRQIRAGCPDFLAAATYEAGLNPEYVAVGDFNGDEESDLAVANGWPSSQVSVLLGEGDGSFGQPTSYAASFMFVGSVAVGDFDQDGNSDLAVGSLGFVSILKGNEDGTFEPPFPLYIAGFPIYELYSALVAELDGDGQSDLVVTEQYGENVWILLGNGDGTFDWDVSYAAGPGRKSAVLGEFNGDGTSDIAIANRDSGKISILLGNGDGTFETTVEFVGGTQVRSLVVGDFDRDGRSDLAVADTDSDNVSILLGKGDGTFIPAINHTVRGPIWLAVGEFDGDGMSDIAAVKRIGLGNNIVILLSSQTEPLEYATGPGISLTVGDFNGDGRSDLAVPNGGSASNVSILLANDDGTFNGSVNYPVGSARTAAVADFDGDATSDLAMSNGSILLGNGDGTFREAMHYNPSSHAQSVAVGDFDGNNRSDLAFANSSPGDVSILLGNGDGTFAPAVHFAAGFGAMSVAVGEFNGDGWSDLAVAREGGDFMVILLGNGDGSFANAVSYVGGGGNSVVIRDFNGDGRSDLAVSKEVGLYSDNVAILLGNGDGTFGAATYYAVGSRPWSLEAADFNGDGRCDLVVANEYSDVSVLLNNGDGTFGDAVHYTVGSRPSSVAVADFNGDAMSDLAIADYFDNNVSFLLGNEDGTFSAVTGSYAAGNFPRFAVAAEFNGDGRKDLAFFGSDVSVLLNSSSCTSITSISPNAGPTEGGQIVGVAGRNLGGVASVTFGETPGKIAANSANSISVITPAHAPGSVDVMVSTAGGIATVKDGYTYLPASVPGITSIFPNVGPVTGGQLVTISGTNLADAISVTFGEAPAAIGSNTATSITVVTPVHAAGIVDVVVTTAVGTATYTAGYTYVDAIPALSEWMLLALAALLAGIGMLTLRP